MHVQIVCRIKKSLDNFILAVAQITVLNQLQYINNLGFLLNIFSHVSSSINSLRCIIVKLSLTFTTGYLTSRFRDKQDQKSIR